MMTEYNRIAGQSIERLAAISDGLFAVAMTLLVLDLHTPAAAAIHSERDLWHALTELAPRLLIYFMSFMTLGIFWIGQQTQLNHLTRSDRDLAWIHLVFLFFVSLVPFTTSLVADYFDYRIPVGLYWLNIAALGGVLYWALCHSESAQLVSQDFVSGSSQAIRRRIIGAQILYAIGASLCFIDTKLSLGCIFLVQLHYALGLRRPRRA